MPPLRSPIVHEILGEHIDRAREQGITSIEQAGDRAWMYQTALRGIAKVRAGERAAAQPDNVSAWNQEWRLSPEHTAELREELRLVARRVAIMENFERFTQDARAGRIDAGLRDYQIEPFEATQAFVSAATQDLLLGDEPLLAKLTKGGYLEEPPSFGKTYFMAAIARAVGTGQPPNEHDQYPIRTLVLTPRRKLVRQTIGKPGTTTKVERGFAAAAPDLNVTPSYYGHHDLSGDVVVMTYQSFINAVRNGTLDEHHFDLILCDEAHRALAPKTMEALNQYRAGRLTIGLTGSPDYDDVRKLENVLPHYIAGSDPITGMHDGYINGFQYWGYRTKSQIHVKSFSSADFTDAEVYPLINDEERNRLILSIMKRDIESGRRGIVRCVRGGDCLHPRTIASLAAGIRIRDPVTGEMRPMRVTAVDYKQDDILDDIIDMLSQPDGPDALAYVGILNEGVDSDAIRFIVDAAPTTSQVVGKQVAGRGYRLDPQGRLTILSQLFDEVIGHKVRYTFLHAVGLEEFEQGLVVATGRRYAGGPHKGEAGQAITQADLPTELREALIEDLGAYCAEELELRPVYGEMIKGSVSLITLTHLGRAYVDTLAKSTVRNILRRVGFEEPVYAKPENAAPGYYYKEGAWERLEQELKNLSFAPKGWRHRSAIVTELGSNTYRFDRFIKERGITGRWYNHPQTLIEIAYYEPAVFDAFSKLEANRIAADTTDVEVLKLAREVGTQPATLERFLAQRNIKWQDKTAASGWSARFLNHAQAEIVREYFGVIEGSLTITEIGNFLGVARSRVFGWMQARGYVEANKAEIKARGDAPRLINYGRRFAPDIVAEAITELTPDEVDDDWVPLRVYATMRGHSYTNAKRFIEAHNIPVRRARDAKTQGAEPITYLDAEGRARFDEVAPPVPTAELGERTMNELKEMTGYSDNKIRSDLTPEQLAAAVPKNGRTGENIGRRAPYFPARTVVALLTKYGMPIPGDVAKAAGILPGSPAPTPAPEKPKPKPAPPAKAAAPPIKEPAQRPAATPPRVARISTNTPPPDFYSGEPWTPVGRLLQDINCDSKGFWVLLRRCNLAQKTSFRRPDHSREVLLMPFATAQIRRLAADIGQTPRNWYTITQIAQYCGVAEQNVHDFIRQITPQAREIELFRSVDTGMITIHYGPRIASLAKQRFLP